MTNKKNVKTKQDLEDYYNNFKLKFKFSDAMDNDIVEIEDIFLNMFPDRSKVLTIFSKNKKIHCSSNRHRSLDDIIKVCKYYFPNFSLSKILKEIVKFENKTSKANRAKGFYFSFCPNIRKDNFRGYNWYFDTNAFKNTDRSFKYQGFPNCNVKISEFLK